MKKIIAVLTVISMVFAFSACSSKKYKETEATVPVTNEQGETVTNSNGEVVTEVITTDGETTVVSSSQTDTSSTSTAADASTKASTTKKASSKTDKSSSASKAEATKKSSSSTSVKTTKSADKSSGEQSSNAAELTTGGKTQNNAASVSTSGASQSTTKKGDATTKKADTSSTTKKEESTSATKKDTTTTTTKPTTTKPATTEKPKKRDIKVKVVLPFYNDEEAKLYLSYKVDGDEQATPLEFKDPEDSKNKLPYELVKLDGETTKTYTIEKVKGDVKVYVYLRDFSGKDNIKNNKVTVKSNETEVTITPLTGIGMVNGDDESLD